MSVKGSPIFFACSDTWSIIPPTSSRLPATICAIGFTLAYVASVNPSVLLENAIEAAVSCSPNCLALSFSPFLIASAIWRPSRSASLLVAINALVLSLIGTPVWSRSSTKSLAALGAPCNAVWAVL